MNLDKPSQGEICLVCGRANIEKLSPVFSRYQIKKIMYVGICRQCGHIQLSPLPTPKEVSFFNDIFLGRKYTPNKAANKNHELKLKLLKERIGCLVKPGMKVLDIGAGEGWTMDYFQAQQCDYFAIEAINELRLSLEERGAEVIGSSVYDDISEYHGTFDLIIFRHILEHLIEPKVALRQIEQLLSPKGMLYLALPNGQNPEIRKGVLTSFFRPVHVSYFHKGNVQRLGDGVGLQTNSLEAGREIVAIMEKRAGGVQKEERHNYHSEMKRVVKRARRKATAIDLKNLLKIVIHRLFLANR
ncbi:class I SAM-dependent methyltransferase [Alkalimarinus coralli]|uniref:class I SAM-dependent methyltransferase n=1 Tax=Alkalimarinus coralli TaxID=2935863 RepID=UPI00202B1E18|nr:class I SAM-dependent methyltransferase [Alkalimarinus coralli]